MAVTVKEILLKWGIDSTNWKAAIIELGRLLDQQTAKAEQQQKKALAQLDAYKAKYKASVIDPGIAASAKLQAQMASEKMSAEAVMNARKGIVAQLVLESKTLQSKQVITNEEYNLLKKITSEIEKQQKLMAGGGGAGGGKGGAGNFLEAFIGGFGSRLAGTIGFAVLSAEGLGRIVEQLTMKMKAFIESTGPLQQVQEQFQKLSISAGIAPTKFIEDLRTSTKGLVDDTLLYRNANLFMQSGVKASEQDIVKLTQATVGLARAQGKDASEAVESLNRFFLTGQARTLAWTTGIQRGELQLTGMSRGMDQATRSSMALAQAQKVILAQYAAMGEPALTYTDVLKKLEVAQHNLMEAFATGFQKSAGFKMFMDYLVGVADKLGSMEDLAREWGNKIGAAFITITEVVKVLTGILEELWDVEVQAASAVVMLATDFGMLAGKIAGADGAATSFQTRMQSITGIAITLTDVFEILSSGVAGIVKALMTAVKEIGVIVTLGWTPEKGFDFKNMLGNIYSGIKDENDKFVTDWEKDNQKLEDDVYNRSLILAGLGKETKTPFTMAFPSDSESQGQEIEAAKQLAKVKEEIAVARSKIELEATEDRIKKEEELLQIQYDQGLITLTNYLGQKGALEEEDHQAKLKQIKEEFAAKAASLEVETREARLGADLKRAQAKADYDTRMQTLESHKGELNKTQYDTYKRNIADARSAAMKMADAEDADARQRRILNPLQQAEAENKANEEYLAKRRQDTLMELNDEVAAQKKVVDAKLKIIEAGLEQEKVQLEDSFKSGEVNANQYLDERVKNIQREYEATRVAELQKREEGKNTATAIAEYNTKMAEASIKQQKDLTQLMLQEDDIREKALEDSFGNSQKILEGQLNYHKAAEPFEGVVASSQGQQAALRDLIALQSVRLQQEENELAGTKALSENWFKIKEKVQQTQETLLKYNEELLKTKTLTDVISSSFGELAGGLTALSEAFSGKTQSAIQNMSKAFSDFAKRQEAYTKGQQNLRTLLSPQGKTEASPEDLIRHAAQAVVDSDGITKKAAQEAAATVLHWQEELDKSTGILKSGIDRLDSSLGIATSSLQKFAGAVDKVPSSDRAYQFSTSRPVGYASGGVVPEDQLAFVHKGEVIIPTKDVGKLPSYASGTGAAIVSGSEIYGLNSALSVAARKVLGLGDASEKTGRSLKTYALDYTSIQSGGSSSKKGIFGSIEDLMSGKSTLFGGKDASGKFTGKGAALGNDVQIGTQMLSQGLGIAGELGQAFSGKGGPAAAAMAGMQGGMQLGQMAGPIGAAVGAAVGGVIGLFSGKARAAAEKLGDQLKSSFQAVAEAVSNGSQTLTGGITAEQQIIQQSVSSLSGKKGGRDELKSILPDMEKGLQQLKDQQSQIIKTFDETLSTLNAPEAYQQQLQSIDAIIQKYQQYIQAGGSVANANEYLQQSYQNLVISGLDSLNNSEQDAINNALNYNNLLLQRQNLIESTNEQIQNIMSQGVATRQVPQGVTKAIQLQKLMLDASTQMDTMNEEIGVSQHKLQNEQTIFNLATTRVGLESQLLLLQNEQTDKSTQQILALQNVVGSLQTALPTSNAAALQQLGLGSAYVSGSEAANMPTPPISTGDPQIDQMNQALYQQELAAWQQNANNPIGYINPAGTAPFSVTTGTTAGMGTTTPSTVPTSSPVPTTITGQVGDLQHISAAGLSSISDNSQVLGFNQAIDAVNSGTYGGGTQAAIANMTAAANSVSGLLQQQMLAVIQQIKSGSYLNTSYTTGQVPGGGAIPASYAPTGMGLTMGSSPSTPIYVSAVPSLAQSAGSAISNFSGTLSNLSSASVPQQQQTTLTNLSMQEISADMARISAWQTLIPQHTTLINLKMQEIAADMARITAWQTMLGVNSGSGVSLEDLLLQQYTTRSRQGFGGFYGESANPI